MKKLVSITAVLTLIICACAPKEEENENDFYDLGDTKWHIEIPENYAHFHDTPDTLNYNNICGRNSSNSRMIEHFKVQENDTLRIQPVPNSMKMLSIAKNEMKGSVEECVKNNIDFARYFFSFGETKYTLSDSEIIIDDREFIQYETIILDSLGNVDFGDINYIGWVGKNWVRISISYKDQKNKNLLIKSVMDSKFSSYKEN